VSHIHPDRTNGLESIRLLLERTPSLRDVVVRFPAGSTILNEGEHNASVYILLEGEVTLHKRDLQGRSVQVDHFTPGALLGLTSFWSGTKSFVQSITVTEVQCLKLDRQTFDSHMQAGDDFSRSLQTLFIDNLSERYRRMVSLNLEVVTLSQALQEERNQLQKAIIDLEQTQSRLIHQEKLATLGQLLAGIAHEINNPCAALISSAEHLQETLHSLLNKDSSLSNKTRELFLAGLNSQLLDSAEKRQRISSIEQHYPAISRSLARRLAQLPDVFLKPLLSAKQSDTQLQKEWEDALAFFETGLLLHSVHLSGQRIGDLVASLKNYGRQGGTMRELVDIRKSIEDTLRVLNHKLQPYTLHLDLPELPLVWIHPGEISQVWTNILLNATDAMGGHGDIRITASSTNHFIQIQIADSGHGIPADHLDKIFETNFTTKNSSKSFGLGLGLTITRNIITKNGGTIEAANREDGHGAVFTIRLPVASQN
jgi:signal transduction histidine kinase